LWTVQNLLKAWAALVQRGDAAYLYEGARPISDAERRSAMVMAAGGRLQEGILSLLQVALPSIGNATSEAELLSIISDESNRNVIADAVLSCWGATAAALAAGFRDTPENRAKILEVVGPDRPITVDNVVAAWHQVQRSRRPASLEEQSEQARNAVPDLESMTDDEVSNLFDSVVADRARSLRSRIL
jgi:hypothetical protein